MRRVNIALTLAGQFKKGRRLQFQPAAYEHLYRRQSGHVDRGDHRGANLSEHSYSARSPIDHSDERKRRRDVRRVQTVPGSTASQEWLRN